MKNKTLLVVFLLVAVICIALSACTITYTVNFYADGQLVQSVTATDTAWAQPEAPTKDGYSFAGWFLDENSWKQPFEQSQLTSLGSTVNVYAKYVPYTIELTCNDVNKIKETDALSAQTFGAKATDSDGQELQVEVNVVSGKQQAGKTVSLRLSATGKYGVLATKELLSVRVYGKPTITRDETILGVKVTDTLDNEFLGIAATDSFDEELFVTTTVDGEQTPGKLLTVTSTATDIMGNVETLTFTVNVYGMPTITANTEISEITVADELNAEFFSATAKDSFGNDLNVTVTTTPQNYEAGDTITVTLSAIDCLNNVAAVTQNVKVYGTPTITANTDISAISVTDELNADFFSATAKDSFGNDLNVAVTATPQNYEAGDTIAITLTAIDSANNVATSTITNVKVHGTPTITANTDISAISVTDKLNAEFFSASAKDSFGSDLKVAVTTTPQNYVVGDTITITLTAIDSANNVATSTITNVKVHGTPTITANTEIAAISVTDELNAEFFSATAKDSFGSDLNVTVTTMPQNYEIGDTITITLTATDILNSAATVTIENVKVYDLTSFTYYYRRLTGLTEQGKSLEEIVIPEYFTSINYGAFRNCTNLKSIVIPNTITSIDQEAFSGCNSLTAVYITDIASWCNIDFDSASSNPLYYAHNLYLNGELVTELELPSTVTKIPQYTFRGCSSLTSVTFGENSQIKSIGSNAFFGCTGLTSIKIPSSVTSIGSAVFRGCSSLKEMTIPFVGAKAGTTNSNYQYPFGYIFGTTNYDGSVKTQQYYYGSSTSNTTYDYYYIPSSIKSVTVTGGNISYGAFYNCNNITNITISDGVTSIGDNAFNSCSSLTSIKISSSVTSTGNYAFKGCSSLTSVAFDKNSQLESIGDESFRNCSSLTSIKIPSSVTSIGYATFSGCGSLEEMTIPFVGAKAGVTSSDTYQYPFGYIFGTSSYTGSVETKQYYYGSSTSRTTSDYYYIPSSLKSVTVTGGNILYGAFYNCDITNITIGDDVTSIGEYAFYNCSSLEAVYITDIAAWCNIWFDDWYSNPLYYAHNLYLNGELVTELELPSTVTKIPEYAFHGCSSLTSMEIPSSITSIGSDAFRGCDRLTAVHITNIAAWCNIEFSNYSSNPLYYAHNLYLNGKLVTELEIPSTVTEIKNYIFTGGSFTNITIPSSVTSIGKDAFKNCSNLTSIVIPNSVTSIGEGAFSGCSPLKEMTIPFVGAKAGVTSSNTYQYPFGYIFGESSYTGGDKTYQSYYGSSTSNTTYDYYYIPSFLKSVTVTGGNILYHAFDNCNNITNITIGDGVTSIGEYAFSNCSNLTSIEIPSSVTSIGNFAFRGCSSLSSIEIPASVTSIGNGAFSGCSSLSSIEIPASVTSIGNGAFSGCSSLSSIEIPASVASIGEDAFYGCYSLTSVEFEKNSKLETIGYQAFYNCSSLTSIKILSSVTSIGYRAFEDCSSLEAVYITDIAAWCNIWFDDWYSNPLYYAHNLYLNGELVTELELPSTVTKIPEYAFHGCSSLTSMEIPTSIKWIGEDAFEWCSSLTSIEIPASVTSIGDGAFYGCSNLTIYCEAESQPRGWNSNWNSSGRPVVWDCNNNEIADDGNIYTIIDGIRYALKDGVATVIRQLSDVVSATIPSSVTYKGTTYPVTSIGPSAFYNCSSITNIKIPANVTSIGEKAFYNCSSLTSIKILSSVTSIDEIAFYNCSSLTIYCEAESQPSNWSSNWNSRRPVVWASNNNDVADDGNIYAVIDGIRYALKDGVATVVCQPSNVVAATIPSSVTYKETSYPVTSISSLAFCNCNSLTSINIPSSVTSIGSGAFNGCSSLKEMTIPFVGAEAGVTSSDTYQYPFGYIFGTSSYTGGVKTEQYYYGSTTSYTIYNYYYIPSSLKSVTVTGGNILYGAFYNCNNITNITIGDGVTSIDESAFRGCSNLTSIEIPASVTSIGEYAFYGCTGLTSVTFEENSQLVSIGKYAFPGCNSLTSIVIPNSVTSIDDYAFKNCSSLTIYCEVESKPSEWKYNWNYSKCPVVWDCNNNEVANDGNIYAVIDGIRYALKDGISTIVGQPSNIVSVTIPSSVTYKGMSYTVTSIDSCAFRGCSSLTNIKIPANVTSIGEKAFYNCSSLASIEIPASVTSIGNYAFYGCSNLTSIKFKDATTWYKTSSSSNWKNQTGGTQTSVTDASNNVTLFTKSYYNYYWYKK